MIVDISAKVRRLILAGLPLALLGCSDTLPRTAPPVDAGVDASADATKPTCFEKEIVPFRGDTSLVRVAFDPADPRWADLYDECERTGSYCAQLCGQLFIVSPRPPSGSGTASGCSVTCGDGGQAIATLQFNGPVPGRRPPSYVAALNDGPGAEVGTYFAECATLEAASIFAFRLLARELEDHNAPPALVSRARAAMKDEAEHFRQMRRLARRYGGPSPVQPKPPLPSPRRLQDVASHNAVEGCVNETFAAVVAGWQAKTANDNVVKQTMAAVARDEAAHAQLAWDVHAWATDQLDPRGKAAVAEARAEAVAQLVSSAGAPVEPALVTQAGLPAPHIARWLAQQAADRLWS